MGLIAYWFAISPSKTLVAMTTGAFGNRKVYLTYNGEIVSVSFNRPAGNEDRHYSRMGSNYSQIRLLILELCAPVFRKNSRKVTL